MKARVRCDHDNWKDTWKLMEQLLVHSRLVEMAAASSQPSRASDLQSVGFELKSNQSYAGPHITCPSVTKA